MRALNTALNLIYTVRFWDFWRLINPDVLTVVNYHRVGNPDSPKNYYKPFLSATPSSFETQLDYLQENYNIVSVKDLIAWFKGEREIPDRAALITIDDCYLDNYLYAYRALKDRWLPAVFMLAVGHIETNAPIFWDLIGFAMSQTKRDFLSLNLAGNFYWNSVEERDENVRPAVEAVRALPAGMQEAAVDEIIAKLGVSIPADTFNNFYLSWDNVLEMILEGISLGSKTINQPILTSIPLEYAYREIVESKKQIENIAERDVSAFSYPGGLIGDYNRNIMKILHRAGYRMAFTNSPGPDEYSEFPRKRFAIRRVEIQYQDTFPRFVAKLNGVSQISEFFHQQKM